MEHFIERLAQAWRDEEPLLQEMLAEVPELCRPHRRELDGRLEIGCLAIQTIISVALLRHDRGVLSYVDALDDIRGDPTCHQCPLGKSSL